MNGWTVNASECQTAKGSVAAVSGFVFCFCLATDSTVYLNHRVWSTLIAGSSSVFCSEHKDDKFFLYTLYFIITSCNKSY